MSRLVLHNVLHSVALRHRGLALLGLLCFGLACIGCGPKQPPPNIVMVVLCTFRVDHTGFGGYDRPTTPFLDQLAAESIIFENAFSASSWTKPSSTSIYTGLTPNVHQMVDDYSIEQILSGKGDAPRTLADGVVTLPEVLQQAGYVTGSRINNVNAGDFFNLTQGYDDTITKHRMWMSRMAIDLDAFLKRLEPQQPFFYMLFILDAHAPYSPDYEDYLRFHRGGRPIPEAEFADYPSTFNDAMNAAVSSGEPVPEDMQTEYVDLYDAALASLDKRLAHLPGMLERAGVADNTLLVVTADHGEAFFEPGRTGYRQTTHGFDLAEPLVRIPLLIHGPGIIEDGGRGRKISNVVRSIDLFPTLAELAGAEPPPVLQGRSLVPLLRGDDDALPPVTAFMSRAAGGHHAVHDGRHKLHWNGGKFTLYDTEQDPYEQHDLLMTSPDVTRRLRGELDTWLEHEAALRPIVGQVGTRELTPEMIEQLKSLGYL